MTQFEVHFNFTSNNIRYEVLFVPEKLIKLKPPVNVTNSIVLSTEAYIYWYPPDTFTAHQPSPNITYETGVDLDYDEYGEYEVVLSPSVPHPGNQLKKREAEGEKPASGPTVTTTAASNATGASQTTPGKTGDVDSTNKTVDEKTTASPNKTTATIPVPPQNNSTVNGSSGTNSNSSASGEKNGTATTEAPKETEVDGGIVKDGILFVNGTAHNMSTYLNKTYVPFHFAKLSHFVVELKDYKGIVNIPSFLHEIHY